MEASEVVNDPLLECVNVVLLGTATLATVRLDLLLRVQPSAARSSSRYPEFLVRLLGRSRVRVAVDPTRRSPNSCGFLRGDRSEFSGSRRDERLRSGLSSRPDKMASVPAGSSSAAAFVRASWSASPRCSCRSRRSGNVTRSCSLDEALHGRARTWAQAAHRDSRSGVSARCWSTSWPHRGQTTKSKSTIHSSATIERVSRLESPVELALKFAKISESAPDVGESRHGPGIKFLTDRKYAVRCLTDLRHRARSAASALPRFWACSR